jgi:hypothetical protein
MNLAFIIPPDFFLFLWGIMAVVITYFVYKFLLEKLLIRVGINNTKVQLVIAFFLSIIIAFLLVSFFLKLIQ